MTKSEFDFLTLSIFAKKNATKYKTWHTMISSRDIYARFEQTAAVQFEQGHAMLAFATDLELKFTAKYSPVFRPRVKFNINC